ncbi:hypothetical protein HAX54_033980, partial [Datura stramonium]|nr:hypothetical protein [Datura stramonium]
AGENEEKREIRWRAADTGRSFGVKGERGGRKKKEREGLVACGLVRCVNFLIRGDESVVWD